MLVKHSTKRQRFIHWVSIALLMIALFCCVLFIKEYVSGAFHSVESLQAHMKQYGVFAPLFLILFQVMQVILPVVPAFLGCAVGSLLFGSFVGFWCNYIGIGVGSIIAFFLVRKFGKPLLEDVFPSKKYEKWSVWLSQSKCYTAFLFLAMLLPLFPDDYLCYLTGVSKMPSKKFIRIIILGKPWCILAYSLGFSLIR